MRIGLKLFTGYFLLVGLAAFFVMQVFVDEVKPGVRQAMESSLVDSANLMAELVARELKAGTLADGEVDAALARANERRLGAMVWSFRRDAIVARVTVTDTAGVVVYDSRGTSVGEDHSRWNDVYLTLRGAYGARSSPETPGDRTRTVMHVAAPIYDPDAPGRLIGVLSLSQPNRAFEPFIRASEASILRKGAWLIALSALIGLAMTAWLSRRIGGLARYARAVSAGEPVPPPEVPNDEIGELGRALEAMRRQLEGKDYVEGYVQSLTHELKSPLSAIRGAAELLEEELPAADRARFAGLILAQQARLTETIDKLLALSAVEQHGSLSERAPVDLAALVDEVAREAEPTARAAGVTLERALEPSVVDGDAFLLRRAVTNLLDNAIAFSPEGGRVRLGLSRGEGSVELEVLDEGPGVPDYARAQVFERFYSLARPKTGQRSSGLGLPFTREVARLHGGSVALGARAAGEQGARATLTLPAQALMSPRGPRTR